MSDTPILLFLHGVTLGNNVDDGWRVRLDATLASLGYPGLANVQIIAPQYKHILDGTTAACNKDLPRTTIKRPSGAEAKRLRREFDSRMASLEYLLGRHNSGNGRLGADFLIDLAESLPQFAQATNYLKNQAIRSAVLHLVIDMLPTSGKVVIIGHSLGSVIAADVLMRLSPDLEVFGVITIGSPLGHGSFDVADLKKSLKEPPAHLGWWVNFWNPNDPVSAHRGLTSVFPWILDLSTESELPLSAHFASTYLKSPIVAEAVGYGLFGHTSKEMVLVGRGIDIPLNEYEKQRILLLRYAFLIESELKDEQKERFAGARREVQMGTFNELRSQNDTANQRTGSVRSLPLAVRELAFDLSDPHAQAPEPAGIIHLWKESAVEVMIDTALANVISPWDIRIPDKIQNGALVQLTEECGLGSKFGSDVISSIKEAKGIIAPDSVNWRRIGAMGLGVAALVAVPGGLVLAAAPGVAGAAAITSSLAAFGPGGMMGGLATAGALTTVGSSTLVASIVRPDNGNDAIQAAASHMSTESFEYFVLRLLATVILREDQQLEANPQVWKFLISSELRLRQDFARLSRYSDKSSQTLKDLKCKIEVTERALDYLREHGHEPATTQWAKRKNEMPEVSQFHKPQSQLQAKS